MRRPLTGAENTQRPTLGIPGDDERLDPRLHYPVRA